MTTSMTTQDTPRKLSKKRIQANLLAFLYAAGLLQLRTDGRLGLSVCNDAKPETDLEG